MNIVILKGNLTRDPDLRYTPNGRAVAEFAIAVNKSWTDGNGQRQEKVSFHECRLWGPSAEAMSKHFSKGKPILIEGELAQEQWDDKETGKKRSKTLVLVNRWHFAGGDRRPAPEEPPDRVHGRQVTHTTTPSKPFAEDHAADGSDGMAEDDIPF